MTASPCLAKGWLANMRIADLRYCTLSPSPGLVAWSRSIASRIIGVPRFVGTWRQSLMRPIANGGGLEHEPHFVIRPMSISTV
jgi:hypothetical protein